MPSFGRPQRAHISVGVLALLLLLLVANAPARRTSARGAEWRRPSPQGQSDVPGDLRAAVERSLRAEAGAEGGRAGLGSAGGERAHMYELFAPFDTGRRELPSPTVRAKGREARLEADDAGTQHPATLETFIQQQRIQSSDVAARDRFGWSVAVSGDTAIVGAVGHDDGAGKGLGKAYIFIKNASGVWVEQQKLQPPDLVYDDHFGYPVAIDGDTAMVGSIAAFVQVYVRSEGVWREQQRLRAGDVAVSGRGGFGAHGIAVIGDTAIIGSPGANNPGAEHSGAAYVFTRSGTTWTEQQRLRASDAAMYDFFGVAVAIRGDTAVVGTQNSKIDGVSFAGAAYIFERSGGVWTERQKLQSPDPPGNGFGWSVAIDGDTTIIGEPLSDRGGVINVGTVHVFERSGGVWSHRQSLRAPDERQGGSFGSVVSISGDTTVVGVPSDNGRLQDPGAVYVFRRSGGVWTERQRLQAADDGRRGFGSSVSISGDTIIASAPGDYSSVYAGVAYIFSNVPVVPASEVLISEFRLSGPGIAGDGASTADEFVELYNNTDSDLTVSAADGSAGWTLRSSDGSLNLLLPNGTRIPARGHYLVANSADYSLAAYPTSTQVCRGGVGCAFPDLGFTSDTPENTGLALFRTANPSSFNFENRLDAVGAAAEPDALYREGAGYAPLTGGAGKVQHSFVRRVIFGAPADSGDNAKDFQLVATNGAATLPAAVLGTPGPENTNSPVHRKGLIKASPLIDPNRSRTDPPNRVRGGAPDPNEPHNSPLNTLKIRGRFTNVSGQSITRLRFRVVDISTTPRPDALTADLRVLESPGGTVAVLNGTLSLPLTALRREDVIIGNAGGGLNTTLSAELPQPLAPNHSVYVEFNLGVVKEGVMRFAFIVEALTDPATISPGAKKAPRRGKGGS